MYTQLYIHTQMCVCACLYPYISIWPTPTHLQAETGIPPPIQQIPETSFGTPFLTKKQDNKVDTLVIHGSSTCPDLFGVSSLQNVYVEIYIYPIDLYSISIICIYHTRYLPFFGSLSPDFWFRGLGPTLGWEHHQRRKLAPGRHG